jgi:AAA15 family ATPase/GTPase
MLLSFGVENFMAFRDSQELSLRRAKASDRADDSSWDMGVSPVVAVYGPNASGKSTLVRALSQLRRAVHDSYTRWDVDDGTNVVPFLLDAESRQGPTSLEIEVRAGDGMDYQYGFTMDGSAVLAEWLYVYRTSRRTLLFRRDGDDLTFGPSFRETRGLREAARARANALTLSVAAQHGNEMTLPVYREVTKGLRVYDAHPHHRGRQAVMNLVESRSELLGDVIQLIRNADLGITDIDIATMPEEVETQLRQKLTGAGITTDRIDQILRENTRQLQIAHSSAAGTDFLPLQFESEGTQALLSFAPVVIDALREGATVVIDEVDTSLHPSMVRALVELFVSPRTNPRQAQLIVTTHDTSLLGSNGFTRILDRDQVWLTEKDSRTGAAELVAVSEYSPRKNENLERGYLTGRYGGLPRLPADLFSIDVE